MNDDVKLVRKRPSTQEVKKEEDDNKKGLFFILFHRKNGKSLFLLLLLLLGSAIMLGTATFAWFTANYTVSVSKLDVTVASGAGIQISVDAINWKSIVTSTELLGAKDTYANAVNQVPTVTNDGTQLSPVSTTNTISTVTGYLNDGETTKSFKGLNMFLGAVGTNEDGDYILTASKESDKNGSGGNYLAFDIFVKSDFSAAKTLYFTGNTGVTGYTADGLTDTNIEYASRIAIINEGNAVTSTAVSALQALDTGSAVTFIEPNYDVHTLTGVAHGYSVYGITTEEGPGLDRLAYKGVKAAIADTDDVVWSETDATANAAFFDSVSIDKEISSTNTDQIEFMTLQPGVTKLRVYAWIEGQDIDCENSASGGSILFTLGFTVEEPEP